MSQIKAVLFDLGLTLLNFEGNWPAVFAQADVNLFEHLQATGIEIERELFTSEFRERLDAYYIERDVELAEHTTGSILQAMLQERGFDRLTEEDLRLALSKLYLASQAFWIVEDDAVATMQTLKQQGYRLGIISNAADDADVQMLVDNANLRDYFDFVISSASFGIRKPSKKIFEHALSMWEFDASEVAMIGDNLGADVLGANNAGLFSVWITRRGETDENAEYAHTIEPDAKIATLQELPELLASL